MRLKIFFLAVLLFFSFFLKADDITLKTLTSTDLDRLIQVCKVWGAVKYLHPYLGYKDIDWDQALIDFFNSDYTLDNDIELSKKLEILLRPLGDLVTRVIVEDPSSEETGSTNSKNPPLFTMNEENFIIITIKNAKGLSDFYPDSKLMEDFKKKCQEAKGVLFDLRGNENIYYYDRVFRQSQIYQQLFAGDIFCPSERFRMHFGFKSEDNSFDTPFYPSFNTIQPTKFTGLNKGPEKTIIFLVNEKSNISKIHLALQAAGKAAIIAENGISDEYIVGTYEIPITQTIRIQIRTSELINIDGKTGVNPDLTVQTKDKKSNQDEAFLKSLELLKNFNISNKTNGQSQQKFIEPVEKKYEDMVFPDVNYRLLALFKIWNVFEYFFPYKNLMERNWEDILREFITRFINIKNETEYALTISEMLTYTHDSHVYVAAKKLREFYGPAGQPFMCRMIEGKPVITKIIDEKVEKKGKIHIGDIILKVDGEDIFKRIERFAKITPAATMQYKILLLFYTLFRGPENSVLTLTVQGENGKSRNVKLIRREIYRGKFGDSRQGEIYKLLSDDIGYADLDRLTIPMVTEMYEKFKNTKAIIFDMRGYPNGTVGALTCRLTDKEYIYGAKFKGIIVSVPIESNLTTYNSFFDQKQGKSEKWIYQGKTVMLIDERTISQAEHTGLFFEAANNTTFIGSPSGGANGNLTGFYLPGGLSVYFSGIGIMHIDGRQLQRIGLQPHIEVRPTIKGIREGRDEVLEKAIEYLKGEFNKEK